MNFMEAISKIESNKDFAGFVENLRQDLLANPDKWENANLERFLEAMSAWSFDSEGYYTNQKKPLPEASTWQTMALILLASQGYE